MRAARRRGGARRRHPRQHLRGDRARPCARRGRRSAGRAASVRTAHRRHRLRGADRARRPSPRCRRSTSSSATRRSSTPQSYARLPAFRRSHAREKVRVNDIMRVRETAPHIDRRLRRPRPRLRRRCRTAATTAAPSASSPSAAAIRAPCRWARSSSRSAGSSANGYREVVLTGVDITAWGADLPGQPRLGAARAADPEARAGACSGCASPRSIRSRPTPS